LFRPKQIQNIPYSKMRRGIIIAVPKVYQEITYRNLLTLRLKLKCALPIEIWEIGKEIDESYRKKFNKLSHISFFNVEDFTSNAEHWRSYQVKAFILKHTTLEEPILCDADMIFHQNPDVIYEDEGYKATGAYFFRDIENWKFHNLHITTNKFQSIEFFNKRKTWLRNLLPLKSPLFPREWSYIYDKNPPSNPVQEALMESGCVYMDKRIHAASIEEIYKLNDAHKETYKYVHGDKETFWIGCVLAGKPYTFNSTPGFLVEGRLLHVYGNAVFFTQKH